MDTARRDKPCLVTIIRDEERRTVEVEARSMYYAILRYNSDVICGALRHHGLPTPQMGDSFEVQVIGQEEVHARTWEQVRVWANRK